MGYKATFRYLGPTQGAVFGLSDWEVCSNGLSNMIQACVGDTNPEFAN